MRSTYRGSMSRHARRGLKKRLKLPRHVYRLSAESCCKRYGLTQADLTQTALRPTVCCSPSLIYRSMECPGESCCRTSLPVLQRSPAEPLPCLNHRLSPSGVGPSD